MNIILQNNKCPNVIAEDDLIPVRKMVNCMSKIKDSINCCSILPSILTS